MTNKTRFTWGMGRGRLWLIAVMLGCLGLSSTAMAAVPVERPSGPLDLTTSPLPITLQAQPGQTVTAPIKVKESGASADQLQVTLYKFTAYGESGKPELSSFGPGDTYKNWVSFSTQTFTAVDNVWQTDTMTIKVPKSAAFEYNYAVEINRVGDAASPGGNQEAIAGGTAILVLLNVNAPGANRSLQLKSFGVEHNVVEFLPTTFDAKFYNNGNVYIQPTGDVFITQGDHQVGTVELNDEQGNILAHTYRIYETEWADGFPYYTPLEKKDTPVLDRHGNVEQVLNWNLPSNSSATKADTQGQSSTNITLPQESNSLLSRLRFGEYTARLVAVYQDDFGRDVPITSQITFWVIPWRILLVFLVILIVFGFAIYTVIRNIVRRRKRLKKLKRKQRPY